MIKRRKGISMIINFKKLLSITTGCFLALSIFADSEPKIIEDADGNLVGIELNLPRELIDDCEDKFWTLFDDTTKTELDYILGSQESFDEWCKRQKAKDETMSVKTWDVLRKYAYILAQANKKMYIINGEFCKAVELGRVLGSIHLKGAKTSCTEAENYIEALKIILLDCF